MLSRALSLATVMLLIGCFAASPALAQVQNLEAGKSPSQIFTGTCTACHKSPRGLLKTVSPGALPGFLRQHYTTSSDMAGLLSSFLISNGATDTRYVGTPAKPAKDGRLDAKLDAKPDARPAGPPDQLDRFGHRQRPAAPVQETARPDAEPQQAAKPDADGLPPQADSAAHQGRNAKRLARPAEAPDTGKPAADGQAPAQAATSEGPDGRKPAAKQKLGKRGKPGNEEPPKAETAKGEPSAEPAKDNKPGSETAKGEASKPEGVTPSGEGKSEAAKVEAPNNEGKGETPALRADPVPPVTPAPTASPAISATASGATPEPAAATPAPTAPSAPAPAVTASAPPPVTPAGPPAPPISQ